MAGSARHEPYHQEGKYLAMNDTGGKLTRKTEMFSMCIQLKMSFRHQPRSRESVWPLVATQVTDINTDPGLSRVTDLHMALGHILGLGVTMAPMAAQATQISQALDIHLIFSDD